LTPEKAFGEVLSEIRKKTDISQEKLAAISGLDRTFISLLERGLRQPSLTSILTLAKALEIKPEKLISDVTKLLSK
jgi:transcriptional regulator with XRE-family HTH domain